jgi:hypothetical protein
MNSRRLSLCTVVVGVSLCACGNYSNEDLDFQLALPEQSDMEAKMQLSVARTDAAEYYRATRSAITNFNDLVGKLAGLIDLVRGQTPTTRQGNERTWGPWIDENQPGWEMRVVMLRSTVSTSLLQMDYRIELRLLGSRDQGWASLLTGRYVSSGSARTGTGESHLHVAGVRNAGFPIDEDPGLANLIGIDITYANAGYPVTVTLDIAKLVGATSETGHYEYSLEQDGSGFMSFDWQGLSETGVPISARMLSRWIGSGAGRADLTADLTPNRAGLITTIGIDCWGVDAIACYTYRLSGKVEEGDPVSCLF